VAAAAAAWRSGLGRGAVAAAADSRMPSLTPVFLCLLSKCLLHVAQNHVHGSFPPEFRPEFKILEDSGTNYSCPGMILFQRVF
jgi:hypothetical protein